MLQSAAADVKAASGMDMLQKTLWGLNLHMVSDDFVVEVQFRIWAAVLEWLICV